MFTDAEIETLAREVIARIVEDPRAAFLFHKVLLTDSGELVPVYGATSEENFGSFLCEFMPHASIRRIISDAEKIFDEFTIQARDTKTGEIVPYNVSQMYAEDRESVIRIMVDCAVLHLIQSFRFRLCELLEEAVTESAIISNATLASLVALRLKDANIGNFTGDARSDIDAALKAASDKRRALLIRYVQALPNVIAQRRRGAPAKSPKQRQRERDAYIEKIEAAYRMLRAAGGKRPTKISVATELGEGGKNLAGGDSRLNALNVKLSRLEINYKELVERIEAELQQ